ncbi:RusA family crossover junction endodeoxyribonuclease [Sulfobacillus thermosulfidooxidans]|uniref:RusA family crossover junction endodeoxyribonuclease n=1 Tax=Sulfobacillus thermosulfidooxidans TaxID=28034 RepID=UPI0012FE6D9D|nr:RusA family crossover junction endodeoxyribonuclease [Sulfobacillus thermosulfidooxidans]
MPLPPTANHMYRPIVQHRHFHLALTPEARAWKAGAAMLARQWVHQVHWVMPVAAWVPIGFRVIWPDRRARDVPNLKALWDALETIIYPNDRFVLPYPFPPKVDRAHPHVTLWIYQFDELPADFFAGPGGDGYGP